MTNRPAAAHHMSVVPSAPEQQSHAHMLLPHLERLDLLLQQEVHRVDLDPDDRLGLAALMSSSENVQARIDMPEGAPDWTAEPVRTCPPAPIVAGRLALLVSHFGLSNLERDILLLSLMPRLDRRYAALFAYVQPHKPNQDWPTLELALRLLGVPASNRLDETGALGTNAPVFRFGLIVDSSGKRREEVPLSLEACASVHAFLVGGTPPVPPLCARWWEADIAATTASTTRAMPTSPSPSTSTMTARGVANGAASGVLPDAALVASLVTGWAAQDGLGPVAMLRGAQGSGRLSSLTQAAAQAHRPVLQLWLNELPEADSDAWSMLQRVLRDARLWSAGLILYGVDEFAVARAALFAAFSRQIDGHPCPVAVMMEAETPLTWVGERAHVLFEMPQRSFAADQQALSAQVTSRFAGHTLDEDDFQALTQRFRPSPQVLGVVMDEVAQYRIATQCDAPLTKAQLGKALALRSQRHFGKLAQRVTPTRALRDVMLSPETERQINEVMATIRHRDAMLDRGFAQKLGRNTGISALFYGDSGTGKTLAAEALAEALGVDLIKIDLSTVVNKYIGETEKNLSRIFDLAARDAGVLFFDEADALFGKRSETKDAHDRHANIEVSYLLQRLENYAGLVVLSTNHRENLDDAFTRRITFMVEFKFPDAAVQERLWRAIWPEQVPVSAEVDFGKLTVSADVAGGNIRNIAWLASCFAEEEGEAMVGWRHLNRAISLEYKKLGRIRWSD